MLQSKCVSAASTTVWAREQNLFRVEDPNVLTRFDDEIQSLVRSKSHPSLKATIINFRKMFPKLSLWERFKDLFGLSDIADNQRDMATLYIAGVFQHQALDSKLEGRDYENTSTVLCHALKDAGLVAWKSDNVSVETLIASVTTRLLKREPHLVDVVSLTDLDMKSDTNLDMESDTNYLHMDGKVSLGYTNTQDELVSSLQNLRFRAQIKISSDKDKKTSNTKEDKKSGNTKEDKENDRIFAFLFEHLPPDKQMWLRIQPAMLDVACAPLFVGNGLLAGKPKVSGETIVRTFKSSDEMAISILEENQHKTFSPDKAQIIMLPSVAYPKLPQEEKKAVEIINNTLDTIRLDMSRSGLPRMRVMVNGEPIPAETLCVMHNMAMKINDTEGITATTAMQTISEEWCAKIKSSLSCDKNKAMMITAALMYSLTQAGPGRSYAAFWSKINIPVFGSRTGSTNGMTDLNIIINDTNQVDVVLTDFNFREGESNDNLRIGEVSFCLKKPEGNINAVEDIITSYIKQDKMIAGFSGYLPWSQSLPEELQYTYTHYLNQKTQIQKSLSSNSSSS